jgi:hypothetical protein
MKKLRMNMRNSTDKNISSHQLNEGGSEQILNIQTSKGYIN